MPNRETETRPNLEKGELSEIGHFLEHCDYRLLPTDDGSIKFVRNLDNQSNYPRLEIVLLLPKDGRQVPSLDLHKDGRRHRVEKRSHLEELEEIKRILDQLAALKPLSLELKVFGNTLRHFLLFGAGESIKKRQEAKGDSYLKELLNHRRRQHRKRREGWERRKKREKSLRRDR